MEKQFVVNATDMSFYKEVPEGQEGKFAVISNVDELADQFDKDSLITLRTNLRGKPAAGDAKKSAKKLAFECFKEATKEKTPAAEKKETAPKKPTKTNLAREILKEKGVISRKDLAEAIGHDESNCHTMMSILKNPKRTKDPVWNLFDKASGTYTIYEDEDSMKDAIQRREQEIQDEKDAAKAAKAQEKADKAAAKAQEKAEKEAAKTADEEATKA